ncbi:hypothetical protein H2204_012023 [Knufia peltigerae]|uniref:Uncharacterized protein n=1 Tax=Knufia peltigerae TaxID=1002370 RepID=A0AA38XUE7_9EURO|nr:hypothetical protein H2204_012023 [Knufia peltigerae]
MHFSLGLLAASSLAVAIASAEAPTATTVETPHPGPPPPVLQNTTVINETIIEICPPPPTVFFNVTDYVPITETATTTVTAVTTATYIDTTTQPITIFQTIISTTVVTATSTVTTTETETETDTETSTTTTTTLSISPTTDTATITNTATDTTTDTLTETTSTTNTATELISEYLTTEQVTSITLCPTRIANPTYTANEPYPTDWTWGCPPGWLCRPQRQNCNFEAGIPADGFYCAPNECIPAEALPAYLPTWDADIYGNATPITNPGLNVQAIDDFFNMGPEQFGLTYQIFVVDEVFTLTSTFLEQPTPTLAARQAQTSVPGACYPWCNNCLLEAQSSGKSPKLCLPGSAFETSLNQCEQCINVHRGDDTGFVQIAPQFQQFLDYCDQYATVVVTTSATVTTSNAGGTTVSVVSSTISTTVTPKASASTSTSSGPLSSSTTVVATTVTTPTSPSSAAPTSPPITTTESAPSTSYTQTTVASTDWPQITIIMPVGDNSTTTVYGSTLPSGSATLVLPEPVSSSPVTSDVTGPAASGTSSASPATFTGAAVAVKFAASPGRNAWMTMLLDLLVPTLLALVF